MLFVEVNVWFVIVGCVVDSVLVVCLLFFGLVGLDIVWKFLCV